MSSAAVGVLAYVLVFIICLGLSVYATVVIRRCDDAVRDPRAITARYENKIQEQDTERIYNDWDSYYHDGDRGNQDDDTHPDLRRTGRGVRRARHLRKKSG